MENQNQGGQVPQHSPEFQRKRKFYMAIPVLIIPFLTMAFWALGGGKDGSNAVAAAPQKGINLALPSAQFKEKTAPDKLGIYQSEKKDSTHTKDGVSKSFMQAMGFDPNKADKDSAQVKKPATPVYANNADQQSANIQEKLAQINRQISQPQPQSYSPAPADQEVKKLNQMMKTMNSSGGNDPEMKQLNDMLTKIQAIQNPQSVKEKPKNKTEDTAFKAIPAIIDGRQKVMNGGTVRLKLTDSVMLKGVTLPKGQLLFGACQVTNQRLLLNIQNIRIGKDILPADLTVFSLDGMPGIPAPEAELSGAAGDGANSAVESMQFLSMDQSLGTQAATGGINAAKELFSKKVKKIRVKLKDNFAVLLRDNTRKR
ncbi:conjugative transposon protein TraM [Mucilaginibacter sp. BJC16-A38]|uniref:conjugative transposon protein TraM n=1 Tax=Mucilaginibacter phenanthrenivorans TaxID=1234842 RepID=UPI0021570714|nr:conjugative transposon protein TraM [Mucilaginibacter phenanthrenivorans]MCR8561947.1 conjugative transposon protein TraM [Mucilaginibacter phenanthrenivorans]